jgi:U5 snRNP spliceosome subunit
MKSRWLWVIILVAVPLHAAQSPRIVNIAAMMDQCPDRDPAFAEISRDFKIRHAGVLLTAPPPCTEPVSAMPVSQYTDELIHLQALRIMYYMDRGMSGHLPWTSGTLYDWMKGKVGGIDVLDGPGIFCCEYFGPPLPIPPPPKPGEPPTPPPAPPMNPKDFFIAIGKSDDFNRDFKHTWRGISGSIALYGHEARHMDDFPHSSCCGIPGGCDDRFDPARLTPYAIQWWLNDLWLKGTINVGSECLPPREAQATASWFLSGVNSVYRERFCSSLPPIESMPAVPGGACPDAPRRRAVRR